VHSDSSDSDSVQYRVPSMEKVKVVRIMIHVHGLETETVYNNEMQTQVFQTGSLLSFSTVYLDIYLYKVYLVMIRTVQMPHVTRRLCACSVSKDWLGIG
jgi:hypothetical protein